MNKSSRSSFSCSYFVPISDILSSVQFSFPQDDTTMDFTLRQHESNSCFSIESTSPPFYIVNVAKLSKSQLIVFSLLFWSVLSPSSIYSYLPEGMIQQQYTDMVSSFFLSFSLLRLRLRLESDTVSELETRLTK